MQHVMKPVPRRTALISVMTLLSAGSAALGAPLDAQSCQRIRTEVQSLEKMGVRDTIAKGPAAGRSLPAAQLEKVKQLIGLDSQLRFRCPSERPFINLKEEPPEDPADAAANSATLDASAPGITLPPGTTVPAVVTKKLKPVVKPVANQAAPASAPATVPVPAAVGATPAMTAAPVIQAKPKPKPKPKTEDAYRPPPVKEVSEPAAIQAPSPQAKPAKPVVPAAKE
jgi:hypothetical protein